MALTGPCRIVDDNSTTYCPESRNFDAKICFADQPVGVGFSYADFGETVVFLSSHAWLKTEVLKFYQATTEESAKEENLFMHSAVHSGRFTPLFASEVLDRIVQLVEAGSTCSPSYAGNGLMQ
jgi:carboxypeptidase C (cathepsin A)